MHTTELAGLELQDRIISEMDKGNISIDIYIDLSKAFDIRYAMQSWYPKLYQYGFRGLSLALMRDYLENRKQFVNYDNFSSYHLTISSGVSQGSILAPFFFLYIQMTLHIYTDPFGGFHSLHCCCHLRAF